MSTNTEQPSNLLSMLDLPMTPEAAQAVIQWKFNDEAHHRVTELAEKARQGSLTDDEEAAIDMFMHLNNVLGILKSRARRTLSASADTAENVM